MGIVISAALCLLIVGMLLPERIRKQSRKLNWLIWLGISLLVLLVVSGKLNLFTALIGIGLAMLTRMPKIVIRKHKSRDNASTSEQAGQRQSHHPHQSMTREEALSILGLKEGATRKDVTMAYKRLMQKLHPDRGGSEALAAEVNRARDTLLK